MKNKNILFIMADQLRWDYLSCYGHPHIDTPNIDYLSKIGVKFNNAFVQSPMCGPSRACFYTGRTVFSNGVSWNRVPLPIGEKTIGDYLNPSGVRVAVVGKTHMEADPEGMHRLGLNKETEIGMMVSNSGFEPFEKDDGLHPTPGYIKMKKDLNYNRWLNSLGYEGLNPWNDYANSAEGENGEILSGWNLRNSNLPARIKEEHSETPYMTMRAKEFIKDSGDKPWFLHLSYIKPHWPYIAPAPYHNMYGPDSFIPVNRDEQEKINPNPVFKAFMQEAVGQVFSKQGVRETVLPGYMGLIKQLDDQLGNLFDFLRQENQFNNTLIVFTSDHGDYLGDHWMGEKELFHDASVKIPLIICDPSKNAEGTRGMECNEMIESLDLLPTFIENYEIEIPSNRLEGISLMPFIHNKTKSIGRSFVFSEFDYAIYKDVKTLLDVDIKDTRAFMIRNKEWKYVFYKTFGYQLFNLKNDPKEINDLGGNTEYTHIKDKMHNLLFERLIERKHRLGITDKKFANMRDGERSAGIIIGEW